MSIIPDKLNQLYAELDRLQASGEDVVADIRAEINNLELEYLKTEVFPAMAKSVIKKLSKLRCEIDFSMQFDGSGRIDYSFCTSGTSILMRDSVESKKATKKSEPLTDVSGDISKTDFGDVNAEPNEPVKTVNEAPVDEFVVDSYKVRLEDYSARSFVVYGVPRFLNKELRTLGGYFSRNLWGGAGWVLMKELKEEVCQILQNKHIQIVEVRPEPKPKQEIIASKPSCEADLLVEKPKRRTSAQMDSSVTFPSIMQSFGKKRREAVMTEEAELVTYQVAKVEKCKAEPVASVYISSFTKLSFMLYGVPAKFFNDYKGYAITYKRVELDEYNLLISSDNENKVRALAKIHNLKLIEGRPDNHYCTMPTEPSKDAENKNLAKRRAFVSYLRSDKAMDASYFTKIVEALDSVQLNRIVKSSTRYDSIYDINDYVYILRIIKAIETDLMEKRIKENLIRALKNYHRFLYYTINGRNIEVK